MTRSVSNGSAGRVLVVEDDEGIREMLKYNLVTAGFSVHEASDGASGLRTARTARGRSPAMRSANARVSGSDSGPVPGKSTRRGAWILIGSKGRIWLTICSHSASIPIWHPTWT